MNYGPFFMPVSPNDIEDIAIGITRAGRFYHSGIIYRDANERLGLLHMRADGCVTREDVFEKWAWAVPQVDPLLLKTAATLCETIHLRNPTYYYGFRFAPPAEFSMSNGDLALANGTVGLTCATFVLTVMRSIPIDLLDLPSWQPRPDDEKWRNEVYAFLDKKKSQYGIPDAIMLANDPDKPCLRYRPEDVIVGAMAYQPPNTSVSFETASKLGPVVRDWVEAFVAIIAQRPANRAP